MLPPPHRDERDDDDEAGRIIFTSQCRDKRSGQKQACDAWGGGGGAGNFRAFMTHRTHWLRDRQTHTDAHLGTCVTVADECSRVETQSDNSVKLDEHFEGNSSKFHERTVARKNHFHCFLTLTIFSFTLDYNTL